MGGRVPCAAARLREIQSLHRRRVRRQRARHLLRRHCHQPASPIRAARMQKGCVRARATSGLLSRRACRAGWDAAAARTPRTCALCSRRRRARLTLSATPEGASGRLSTGRATAWCMTCATAAMAVRRRHRHLRRRRRPLCWARAVGCAMDSKVHVPRSNAAWIKRECMPGMPTVGGAAYAARTTFSDSAAGAELSIRL